MTYTFDQLKEALNECTSYDLQPYSDGKEYGYLLIDPFSDIVGYPFFDLDEVVDYITNNDQVADYLTQLDNCLKSC